MGVTLSLFGLQLRVPKNEVIPRLEINIPMPAGAVIPRAPQSQPASIPQSEPAQPAAAQSR
jgi:hypothetical protein